MACSQDSLALMSEEILSSLRAKHPPQPDGSCLPPAPQVDASLRPLADGEIVRTIRSFLCSSAGGPDGLRPQHFVDHTSASAERGGWELISALSSFIHHVIEGHVPSSIERLQLRHDNDVILLPYGKKSGMNTEKWTSRRAPTTFTRQGCEN